MSQPRLRFNIPESVRSCVMARSRLWLTRTAGHQESLANGSLLASHLCLAVGDGMVTRTRAASISKQARR